MVLIKAIVVLAIAYLIAVTAVIIAFLWCCCKVASDADDRMNEINRRDNKNAEEKTD